MRSSLVRSWTAVLVIGLLACSGHPASSPTASVALVETQTPSELAATTAAPPVPTASASSTPLPEATATASVDPAKLEAARDGAASQIADAAAVGEVLALQARLLVVDTVVGTGREVQEGDHVSVHCVGTLADGSIFDSSRARKRPLLFTAGGDGVVKGLAEGVVRMRVGGHRTLTVPPALGFGRRGSGKKVPPNASLTYDVEVLSVK